MAAFLAVAVTLSAAGAPPANDNWANAITLDGRVRIRRRGRPSRRRPRSASRSRSPPASTRARRSGGRGWRRRAAPYTFAATSSVRRARRSRVFTGASVDALTEVAPTPTPIRHRLREPRLLQRRRRHDLLRSRSASQPSTSPGRRHARLGAEHRSERRLRERDRARQRRGLADGLERRRDGAAAGRAGHARRAASITPSGTRRRRRRAAARTSRSTPTSRTSSTSTPARRSPRSTHVGRHGRGSTSTAGTTYSIQIGTGDGGPGTFLLTWALDPAPINDDLANADDLYGGQTRRRDARSPRASRPASRPSRHRARRSAGRSGTAGSRSAAGRRPSRSRRSRTSRTRRSCSSTRRPRTTRPSPTSSRSARTSRASTTRSTPSTRTVDGASVYYIQVLGDFSSEQDVELRLHAVGAVRQRPLRRRHAASRARTGRSTGTTVGATFPESCEPDPSGDDRQHGLVRVDRAGERPGDVRRRRRASTRPRPSTRATRSTTSSRSPTTPTRRRSRCRSPRRPARPTTSRSGRTSTRPGAFTLTWHLTARPANDDLVDAERRSRLGSIDGNTRDATIETGCSEPTDVDVGGDAAHRLELGLVPLAARERRRGLDHRHAARRDRPRRARPALRRPGRPRASTT